MDSFKKNRDIQNPICFPNYIGYYCFFFFNFLTSFFTYTYLLKSCENSFRVGLKVWEVLGRPKATRFWSKYFWAVLMENDKNCSRNHVGDFWSKTNSFLVGLKVWKVLGRPKVTKFWPEYFWAVLMENDKNCSTNNLGAKPTHSGLVWKFGKFGMFWEDQKWQSFDRNIFGSY